MRWLICRDRRVWTIPAAFAARRLTRFARSGWASSLSKRPSPAASTRRRSAFSPADLALGGTLVVLTSWLAPVVVLAVSALVAITAVAVALPSYGATLRSLLDDAEALLPTQADGADGALRWLIVEDLNDTLDVNARTLRFKGYLVTGAIAVLLLGVVLILAHNP